MDHLPVREEVAVDPVMALADAVVPADPGGQARTRVTVRNVGEIVAQYRLEVLGEAARWSTVVPQHVSVLPGDQAEQTVEVVFRPPGPPAAPVGTVPFGVRCVSLENRDVAAVVEGDLVVSPVQGLDVRVRPDGAAGARGGRFRVELHNTGTVPVSVQLRACDAAELLRFALAPRDADVDAGRTTTAYLAVAARTPRLTGAPVTHPFTLAYTAAGASGTGEVQGTWVQRPLVRTVHVVLAVLLVAALVLSYLWLARQGASTQLAVGEPPPVVLEEVAEVEPGTVRIAWVPSAYATQYLVRSLLPDGSVDAQQEVDIEDKRSVTWPGLPPGQACFTVSAVTDGGTSVPSETLCAAVTEAGPTAEPTPTSPTPTAPAGAADLTGFYVIYGSFPLADSVNVDAAAQLVAALQTAGATGVRLVNSLDSPLLQDGIASSGALVVLKDGFASEADAVAECTAFRAVAGSCLAQGPAP